MPDIPIPPIPPRRAPLIDIMRELEARPRQRQPQEFDPVAALAAERRSQSRQPLPLPPIPPAVAPPRTAGDSAEAGPPLDLSAVAPTIRSRLPEGNPYVAAAIDIAEKYNLPRDVFLSLVHQESKFDPKAKSPRGAFGLAQLMPGTARELGVDPRDPMANLDAGARYLRQQIDRFGSLPLALAAYNAGPQRVIDAGRVVPNIRETQDYVHKIMRNAGMEGYGYAEGGLAELDEKYANGGTVRAPKETTIAGQEHKLAYITDREAALLKARGGSGRMTDYGVRAYDEGPGGQGPGGDPSDNANSMSESATQDAVGGNQGQGAGPTGAGAGGGPPGNDPGPTGEGQSEVNTPGMAPGISTAPTAVGPIGPEDEANAAAAKGAMANAPMGFEGYGIMDAIDAYNSGRMGLAQAIGYGIASVAAPPGVSVGFNVDPQTQTQTPAMSVSVPGVIGGLMGLATGVPGAGVIGGFIGNEIGKELGLDPTVMSYEPGVFNAPEPTPAYGAAGYGMDYGQGYAHGGLAKLHQKYAEGGEVEDDGGVERYDPREIDALASEFMAESNPADLMQRARLMMRGMNVGMPTNVGALNLSDNENVSTYTGLREMPIEDDRFARALRTLNTGINATLDQERGIRLGAGLQALQDAGDRGMSGYGANLSAGYGPVSLHGGYQSQLQAYPGAKPQGVYTYGGNLNIPLDDEGAKALLGAQVMSGRRGSAGAGNAGTLITGGLERPFRGGTLGVDVSVDPTLRNKEILFGYRRAF